MTFSCRIHRRSDYRRGSDTGPRTGKNRALIFFHLHEPKSLSFQTELFSPLVSANYGVREICTTPHVRRIRTTPKKQAEHCFYNFPRNLHNSENIRRISVLSFSSQPVDWSWNGLADKKFQFMDHSLVACIRSRKDRDVTEFFKLLSLCHTVMVENKDGKNPRFRCC